MPLDRRQFLAAGAAAISTPLGARPSGPAREIKKALKYGMIGEGSTVLEKFQVARDVGFDGVELDSPNGLSADEVLRAKEETGIEIPGVVDSVHWAKTLGDPDPEVRAAGLAGLETALRDCKTYGGSTVLLVPGVVNERMPYHLVWERSQIEIKKALPLAEELGIELPADLPFLGPFFVNKPDARVRIHLFYAPMDLALSERRRRQREGQGLGLFTPDETATLDTIAHDRVFFVALGGLLANAPLIGG